MNELMEGSKYEWMDEWQDASGTVESKTREKEKELETMGKKELDSLILILFNIHYFTFTLLTIYKIFEQQF